MKPLVEWGTQEGQHNARYSVWITGYVSVKQNYRLCKFVLTCLVLVTMLSIHQCMKDQATYNWTSEVVSVLMHLHSANVELDRINLRCSRLEQKVDYAMKRQCMAVSMPAPVPNKAFILVPQRALWSIYYVIITMYMFTPQKVCYLAPWRQAPKDLPKEWANQLAMYEKMAFLWRNMRQLESRWTATGKEKVQSTSTHQKCR